MHVVYIRSLTLVVRSLKRMRVKALDCGVLPVMCERTTLIVGPPRVEVSKKIVDVGRHAAPHIPFGPGGELWRERETMWMSSRRLVHGNNTRGAFGLFPVAFDAVHLYL